MPLDRNAHKRAVTRNRVARWRARERATRHNPTRIAAVAYDGAVLGMLSRTERGSRFEISEALRNLADVLECPLVAVVGAALPSVQRRGRADQ